MMLFDSHAHYEDERFDCDRDALLSSMPAQNVGWIVNVGCDPSGAQTAVRLAERYPFVYASIGVHPQSAGDVTDEQIIALETLYSHPKVVAVGEIGLDYYYEYTTRERQKDVFIRQLETAARLNLPVCIHNREAHADTLDVLRAFRGVRGVLHSYSGSLEMAKELLKLGYVFSFSGIITFKNAKRCVPIIAYLPSDAILIETDCPYLAPEPMRGRRCDSSFLRYTCARLAEIRGISFEQAAELTTQNAKRLYGIF